MPLANDHHVLRYIAPKHIDNGIINGSGFLRRPHEQASSVNWMECLALPVENQVSEVRAVRRLTYAKSGRLAQVNVGATKRYVDERVQVKLEFCHDPLEADLSYPADPSHALIRGIPAIDTPHGELIQDLLAECIIAHFPAMSNR
jgi:hypothetical protein